MVNGALVLFFNVFLAAAFLGASILVLRTTPDWRSTCEGKRPVLLGYWLSQTRLWGIFLLILGVKLYWLYHYVTNVPFWDQWGAEGLRLYLPIQRGELPLSFLFHHHNEHRIFWTRIWALGQFLVNGQWDIRWQTLCNAIFHSAVGAVFCEAVLRHVRMRGEFLWILLFTVVFAGPYACVNLLFGFQSQFYFLQFFGAAGLFLLFGAKPGSPSWIAGWLCLLGAFFSGAGGVLVIGVALVGWLVRVLFPPAGRRLGLELAALAGLAILFATTYASVPHIPHHDALKAQSLGRLLESFLHLAAWPLHHDRYDLVQAGFFGLVLWLPWIICMAAGMFSRRVRQEWGSGYWLLLVFGGWVLASALGTAYSRGALPLFGYSGRYADLFGQHLLVSALAIAGLLRFDWRGPIGMLRSLLALATSGLWIYGICVLFLHSLEVTLPFHEVNGKAQEEHLENYLQTGDPSHLMNKGWARIPLDSPEILMATLEHEEIRSILPSTVREPIPLEGFCGTNPPFLLWGVAPGTERLPGQRVWGSFGYDEGVAYEGKTVFTLTRPSEYPFLTVDLAGYPREEGNRLAVRYESGDETSLWRTEPRTEWLERRFSAGKGETILIAEDATAESWFAFTEPREMGFFSFYALWFTKWYDRVPVIGLLFLLTAHFGRLLLYPPGRGGFFSDFARLRAACRGFVVGWKNWEPGRGAEGSPQPGDRET